MTQHPRTDGRRPPNAGPKASARNRAALIAAAREVFAEQGINAALSSIARRAGVGQGVLYRHFPDRAAVAAAVLEENVREVEQAAAAEGASFAMVLGVLSWHMTESAAFISVLHGANEAAGGSVGPAYARELSDRVEYALRTRIPDDHRLAEDANLMLAVGMVSGAVIGPTREDRERRVLDAWRLLAVEVGPVRPFDG
ncbi:helix-turn-helix domain-containing protein [Streptomyces sp. NPDC057376]|uniref:TetR/AcrR family transcriptional regulator n=1 Tax=unclassified Streptomyces TaxID=2593676 RepID=UPI00093A1FD8|nr:TetR/AcrR family transcriptional regulator [Streptomyces sp. CB02414]OKI86223.1 TetR family transcriptional regulator [Streptomyces sp. CB02414]